MNILFIATKSPWPAVDGGRLLMVNTLEGLAAAGHRVTVVAPVSRAVEGVDVPEGVELRPVVARPRPMPVALVLSQLRGRPVSMVRHGLEAVAREVARSLDEGTCDLVHAEQLQALPQAAPAFDSGVPVVLRAQNVESDLWAGTARAMGPLGVLARREALRMARAEGEAVARAQTTAALTSEDAARLRELASGGGTVDVVRAPFARTLALADEPLAGSPALVLLGSRGWLPNRDAAEWFVSSIWPAARAVLPEARLHVFGTLKLSPPPGVELHSSPADSREAFAPGSVQIVPLRIGSGVRMKILEAWARGVPVVASRQAVRGLEAVDGRDVLVARDVDGWIEALRRLRDGPDLARRLTEGGRSSLAERHDPAKVTRELVRVYEQAVSSSVD